MWSAKPTSSANCSDFLPNPDSRLTDLYCLSHLLQNFATKPHAVLRASSGFLARGPSAKQTKESRSEWAVPDADSDPATRWSLEPVAASALCCPCRGRGSALPIGSGHLDSVPIPHTSADLAVTSSRRSPDRRGPETRPESRHIIDGQRNHDALGDLHPQTAQSGS